MGAHCAEDLPSVLLPSGRGSCTEELHSGGAPTHMRRCTEGQLGCGAQSRAGAAQRGPLGCGAQSRAGAAQRDRLAVERRVALALHRGAAWLWSAESRWRCTEGPLGCGAQSRAGAAQRDRLAVERRVALALHRGTAWLWSAESRWRCTEELSAVRLRRPRVGPLRRRLGTLAYLVDGEKLKPGFRCLWERYNERANAIEPDESTPIDVPPDLD
jgi:hypothetical protein